MDIFSSAALDSSESPAPASTSSVTVVAMPTEDSTANPESLSSHETDSEPIAPPAKPKERPHKCTTCNRDFARLEHLKRHERSHTKEKPFACDECDRCFARRDLLLRHQQKLHHENHPPAKPRAKRRASAAAAAAAASPGTTQSKPANRVRKASTATVGPNSGLSFAAASTRPRACTLGHLDLTALGINHAGQQIATPEGNSNIAPKWPDLATMSHSPRQRLSEGSLPAETFGALDNLSSFNSQIFMHNGSMNPPHDTPSSHFPLLNLSMLDTDGTLQDGTCNNTVNPAQLHFPSVSTDSPITPFGDLATFPDPLLDANRWSHVWDQSPIDFNAIGMGDECAIDDTSPMKQTPPTDFRNSIHQSDQSGTSWGDLFNPNNNNSAPAPLSVPRHSIDTTAANTMAGLTMGNPVAGLDPGLFNSGTSIPQQQLLDMFAPSPSYPPSVVSGSSAAETPSERSSANGSHRHNSVTSNTAVPVSDTAFEVHRRSLHGPARHSIAGAARRRSSHYDPLSRVPPLAAVAAAAHIPFAEDLPDFLASYQSHFHPHLPFLHPNAFGQGIDQLSALDKSGCLISAVASVGALFRFEHDKAMRLFTRSQRLIMDHLAEFRRLDGTLPARSGSSSPPTMPLWFIQARLLTVIFGLNCGNHIVKATADQQLPSLGLIIESADLGNRAWSSFDQPNAVNGSSGDSPASPATQDLLEHLRWISWREVEERKRTYFAAFVLSSLLTTGYNHAPFIPNTAVKLDLPCDEELWAAETAKDWQRLGGAEASARRALPFISALSSLFHPKSGDGPLFASPPSRVQHLLPGSRLETSEFGCFVLINAIHNHIWEVRSMSRVTGQSTEHRLAEVRNVLRVWYDAWTARGFNNVDRAPGPVLPLCGPGDCDSLYQLAFVRLEFNIASTKESFWEGEFGTMAQQFIQASLVKPGFTTIEESILHMRTESPTLGDQSPLQEPLRELRLRKVAGIAIGDLLNAARANKTFAERMDLPIQSAMQLLDYAQVIAEWIAAIQERLGPLQQVLIKMDTDAGQLQAQGLLDAKDAEILHHVRTLLEIYERVIRPQWKEIFGLDIESKSPLDDVEGLEQYGLGSRLLIVSACMLERAAVWPVMQTMASAMKRHAVIIQQRSRTSIGIHLPAHRP